jgi:hypothetical protein
MAVRREHQQRRRMELLNAIDAAVDELRIELRCGDERNGSRTCDSFARGEER